MTDDEVKDWLKWLAGPSETRPKDRCDPASAAIALIARLEADAKAARMSGFREALFLVNQYPLERAKELIATKMEITRRRELEGKP